MSAAQFFFGVPELPRHRLIDGKDHFCQIDDDDWLGKGLIQRCEIVLHARSYSLCGAPFK